MAKDLILQFLYVPQSKGINILKLSGKTLFNWKFGNHPISHKSQMKKTLTGKENVFSPIGILICSYIYMEDH